jgi:hypothetical protein
MPSIRLIACLLVLACSFQARALDLYSGEVFVTGHGVEERSRAAPAALIQVLQKLSGQRELPLNPALDSALLSANRILVSFHYRNRERLATDGSTSEELWLVASFLPEAVERIARDLQLPRWRRERQPLALWVVVDDGLGRRLKPVEYEYAWASMADVATMRGLPVTWPEVQEDAALGPDLQLLWGGFTEGFYNPDTAAGGVAIVAARRAGPEWSVRWTVFDGEQTAGWRNQGQELRFVLAEGVHRLTDQVAARNSIAAAALGDWELSLDVAGILTAGDYARCLEYLEDLSLVERVHVQQVSAGTVRFLLKVNARPEFLEEAIARDRVLRRGTGDHAYQLIPRAVGAGVGDPEPGGGEG